MDDDRLTYYELLGVPDDAPVGRIEAAYRRAALRCHPQTDPRPEALARFGALADAHRVLTSPELRLGYDRSLAAGVEWRLPRSPADESAAAALRRFEASMLALAYELGGRGLDARRVSLLLDRVGCPLSVARAVAATLAAERVLAHRAGSAAQGRAAQGGGAQGSAVQGVPCVPRYPVADTTGPSCRAAPPPIVLERYPWPLLEPFFRAVIDGEHVETPLDDATFARMQRQRRAAGAMLVAGLALWLVGLSGALLPAADPPAAPWSRAALLSWAALLGMGLVAAYVPLVGLLALAHRRRLVAFERELARRRYLAAFESFHEGRARPLCVLLNVRAFLFASAWLAGRRMPLAAAGSVALVVALTAVAVAATGQAPPPAAWLAVSAVFGLVADRLLFARAARLVRAALWLERDEAIAQLRAAGGVDRWRWLPLVVLPIAALAALEALLAR